MNLCNRQDIFSNWGDEEKEIRVCDGPLSSAGIRVPRHIFGTRKATQP
jgi:hypothetical protein